MKPLEVLLGFALSCCHDYPDPVIPHPIPHIFPHEKNDCSPEILLTYNHELPWRGKGLQEIVMKSRTYGGTLKIELSDSEAIRNYYVFLNAWNIAYCSRG